MRLVARDLQACVSLATLFFCGAALLGLPRASLWISCSCLCVCCCSQPVDDADEAGGQARLPVRQAVSAVGVSMRDKTWACFAGGMLSAAGPWRPF